MPLSGKSRAPQNGLKPPLLRRKLVKAGQHQIQPDAPFLRLFFKASVHSQGTNTLLPRNTL
jgi:hypothetical protein